MIDLLSVSCDREEPHPIRIDKSVARFVSEWPLTPTQVLEVAPHGAVDVCAPVYGLHETLRWVLRWGKGAEVRAPEKLRAMVRAELEGALGRYGTSTRRRQTS